jgi:hypothetical protein
MEFGVSKNDAAPVTSGSWLFLVGEAEPWISPDDQTTGCILWKQDVEAKRIPQDKYEYPEFQAHPQTGSGPLCHAPNDLRQQSGGRIGLMRVRPWMSWGRLGGSNVENAVALASRHHNRGRRPHPLLRRGEAWMCSWRMRSERLETQHPA